MIDVEPPGRAVDAEFVADRRRTDGTRTVWAASPDQVGVALTRWDLTDGAWRKTSTTSAASWSAAVGGDAQLTALRHDEATAYTAPEADDLLPLLVAEGDGDPEDQEWPFGVTEYEDDGEGFMHGDGHIPRYATVNERRLHFAACEPIAVPFLMDEDSVIGEQLAEFMWGSEAGMTSGAGGYELFLVSTELAVSVPTGDELEFAPGPTGLRFVDDAAGLADMLATWVGLCERGCGGAAALTLEPLDPGSLLTDEQRDQWQAELDHLRGGLGETVWVDFDVAADVKSELRRRLATEGSTYEHVREALANPVEGDWLRASLAEGDLSVLW